MDTSAHPADAASLVGAVSTTTLAGAAGSLTLDTEVALVDATLRLHAIRRAALFGQGYDPEQYDAAIFHFRRARAASARARLAWHAAQPSAA